MSKNHRGTGLRNLPAHGRGTCPVCKADNIKLLYEQTVDGQQVKVCKYCNAAIKRNRKMFFFIKTPGFDSFKHRSFSIY